MFKTILCALTLMSCSDNTYNKPLKEQMDKETLEFRKESIETLYYTRDPRTNLCFASHHLGKGSHSATIANVPCSEVEKYLDK